MPPDTKKQSTMDWPYSCRNVAVVCEIGFTPITFVCYNMGFKSSFFCAVSDLDFYLLGRMSVSNTFLCFKNSHLSPNAN